MGMFVFMRFRTHKILEDREYVVESLSVRSSCAQISPRLSFFVSHFYEQLLLSDPAVVRLAPQHLCDKSVSLLSQFILHCPKTSLLDVLPLSHSLPLSPGKEPLKKEN